MVFLTTSPGCATTTHPTLSAVDLILIFLTHKCPRLTAILSERMSTIDKVDVFFTGTPNRDTVVIYGSPIVGQGTYYPASYPALTTVPVVNVRGGKLSTGTYSYIQ